jgi:hypothetical protein
MTTTIPTTAQVAQTLERGARIAAPFIAFSVTAIILLAELTYELGYQMGSAVHERNDQMSRLWVRLWLREAEVLAEPVAAPIPVPFVPVTPVAPAFHPLAMLAAELHNHTSSELRRMTGSRRRCSKAELVAAYVTA